MTDETDTIKFRPAADDRTDAFFLVLASGPDAGREFSFSDEISIGRLENEEPGLPRRIMIRDATISSNHCTIRASPDGRVFVEDTSRNGTRLDGRLLSPNIRTEIKAGQVISVGSGHHFRLEGEPHVSRAPVSGGHSETQAVDQVSAVTVLVGDICDYTGMVQAADPVQLRKSAGRVFKAVEETVLRLGGSIGGYQGDSVLAFWEKATGKDHAIRACSAALELKEQVENLAAEPSVWSCNSLPLAMDWALASGWVTIQAHGDSHAMGLAMVGEPVVLAFRIEQLASAKTGRIIACSSTKRAAEALFRFKKLGAHQVKGFDRRWELFSLVGKRNTGPFWKNKHTRSAGP